MLCRLKTNGRAIAALCGLLVAGGATAGVMSSQTVSLAKGWNAFYLTVSPEQAAGEVFADWPVDFVSAYDAAAFQETRQYSANGSTEGSSVGGYRTWHRATPGISSLTLLPANTVYVCYASEAMEAKTVFGRPAAPRITWHVSSTNEPMNIVGLSTTGPTAPSAYFEGLDVHNTTYKSFYGTDPASVRQRLVYDSERLANGAAVLTDAVKVSDWSGVLNVSPAYGVDFGTNGTLAAVQVRNDGNKARTVKLALTMGTARNLDAVPAVPAGLQLQDASTVATAAEGWRPFRTDAPFSRRLEAGETLSVSLALDRTQLPGPAGTPYGALLVITDEDGGSNMKVVLPVDAIGDGGAASRTAWPVGIWLAVAELDTVTHIGTQGTVTPDEEIPAGGKMTVRLPMAVDGNGCLTLLQRFWYGCDEQGNLHVLTGSETSDVPLANARRVSTAFLPTDQVKISATNGTFGTRAIFPFVVAETSSVNPMRHAFHPQHDGKRFDFTTPSPSGDVLDNYKGAIKPESFSITNTVEFVWTNVAGTAWSPEETVKGRLVWEFGGLRHEGAVRASGSFVMKRLTAETPEK